MDSPSELSKVKLYFEHTPEAIDWDRHIAAAKRRAARHLKKVQIAITNVAFAKFVKD